MPTVYIIFAFETTLSSRSYVPLVLELRKKGYRIVLIFFYLSSISIAFQRVRTRVLQGGHDVPKEVIQRRYKRGLINLHSLYLPVADQWWIYDNSKKVPQLVVQGAKEFAVKVFLPDLWKAIQENKR